MKNKRSKALLGAITMAAVALVVSTAVCAAGAVINGVTGPTFNLTAKADFITTGDGDSVYMWGFALPGKRMQYPGPTLIVTEGDFVTIILTNELSVPVSIIFPGQTDVGATGDATGLLTEEAAALTGSATYTFKAKRPGTYLYQSGTQMELQTEMGLQGALIVRPACYPTTCQQAYNNADTAYDHEYLFFMTEIDPTIHALAETGSFGSIDNTTYHPVLWFYNGRNGPDTLYGDNLPWMPTQPYGALVRSHPGEKILMRLVGGSRDAHPHHTHGNNFTAIARDGRLLQSAAGGGATDLAYSDYTLSVAPGTTYDALFTWTGKDLGWDVYGTDNAHTCNGIAVDASSPASPGFDPVTHEYCPDHGKPIPVTLPGFQDLTFGAFYSGSPYLGAMGSLPPGEGGFNPNAGFAYMWHSHTERELVNNNIFPGGMLTLLIIEPPGVPIP